MNAVEITDDMCPVVRPLAGPCPFHASRPSGLCGIHDNVRKRTEDRQAADARRSEYARTTMQRVGPVVRALTALGIDAQPRLSGVLITIEGAERLIARLTTHTEGAAQ